MNGLQGLFEPKLPPRLHCLVHQHHLHEDPDRVGGTPRKDTNKQGRIVHRSGLRKEKKQTIYLKNSHFLIQKISYFISISLIWIFLWVFNEIVENQDLKRNKDEF